MGTGRIVNIARQETLQTAAAFTLLFRPFPQTWQTISSTLLHTPAHA
jgi:hypothetical protein